MLINIFVDLYFLYDFIHAIAGIFLVNSLPTLVLFNSSASQSFVLSTFNRNFHVSLGSLDRPLEVAIIVDRTISAPYVYHDCVLEIFGVGFMIDLSRILMTDVSAIVGMDWLSQVRALIDCEH